MTTENNQLGEYPFRIIIVMVDKRLGFGTSHLHRILSSHDRQAILQSAYDAGLRHFDTARLYGYGIAEGELGKFSKGRRHELRLATKVGYWFPCYSMNSQVLSMAAKILSATEKTGHRLVLRRGKSDYVLEQRDYALTVMRKSLSASLKALRTDYLDSLLLHEFEPKMAIFIDDIFDWLSRLKESGVIREFGIAGDRWRCNEVLAKWPDFWDVVQASDTADTEGAVKLNGSRCSKVITYGYFRGPELNQRTLADRIEGAVDKNRFGMILFSSTKTSNVASFVQMFSAIDQAKHGVNQ